MARAGRKNDPLFSKCIFLVEYADGDVDSGEVSLPSGDLFTLEEMEAFLAEEAGRPVVSVVCVPKEES